MGKTSVIKFVKAGAGIILFLLFLFIVLNAIFPIRLEDINYSKQIFSSDSTLLNTYLNSEDKWRLRSNIDEINKEFVETIIYKEDRWFYYHPGVNPVAIIRAFYQNITSGRRVSGASTITMQLARLMEPKNRTYSAKFVEILRAIQLEILYSKDEILEAYLNLLPYGGNIEGVKAASLKYFNRVPAKLSIAQSVLLSIIPNDPNNLKPGISDKILLNEKESWLKRMRDDGLITEQEYFNAIEEKLPGSYFAMPSQASHIARRLTNESTTDTIYTTIHRNAQSKVEAILKGYITSLNSKGIFNGAVLVIDNKSGEIVVYAGSHDFNDKFHGGEVDGISAIRSPGSTLKPILYAELLDNYGYTPARIISDIPTDFGGYSPDNFDEKFNGPVRFDFALKNSLNIPAVKLLSEIGYGVFLTKLEDGGFETIKAQKEYLGLSMILGGCGTSLLELTRFYSTFGNNGELKSLKFLKNAQAVEGKRMFSEESSWLIYHILSSIERPDVPNEFLSDTKLPELAWKTGTSYGRRDAWAIGFNNKYTIGVWAGNFNGTGSPFLTGAEVAVPLLFDISNYLLYNKSDLEPVKPDGIKVREVCVESGKIPGDFCENTITDYYLSDKSSIEKCDAERELFVSNDEKVSYCTSCLPVEGYKRKVYKVYSPEIKLWMAANNNGEKIPVHNPECTRIRAGNNLSIVSPVKDYEYIITNLENNKIALKAASTNGKTLYWFINGKFIGKAEIGNTLFTNVIPGENEIVCVDDLGSTAKVAIVVKKY